MWFLYILSWISSGIHICIITLSVAAALYYLAELVEEFTVLAGKVIQIMVFIDLIIYIGLFLFENLPTSMIIVGIISQFIHLILLRTFPYFVLTSPPFIISIFLVFINHYLAFIYFAAVYYAFSEVLAYFTVCLWIVPFSLFVSLSANENVLPTIAERQPLMTGSNDVVTNYFSSKGKKYGLLSFFNYAKDSILPQRIKKSY